jgi:hypothetical protein
MGCKDKDDAKAKTVAAKPTDADDDAGPGVTLKAEAQKLAGLRVVALEEQQVEPEVLAYGRLEEDPSLSFTVRAPAAGVLRAANAWPGIGQTVASGTVLGFVEQRLQISDRLTLNTQLAAARADLKSAQAAVTAAQTAYDRTKALNADNKNVSDRAVQEAGAKVASEKAHEAGAQALIQTLESSLGASPDARPVVAVRGGEVVEAPAQPGESVEQGAALLRVAQFDHLLARIEIPVGERGAAGAQSAGVVPAGSEDQAPLAASRVATVAVSDTHALGAGALFRLTQMRAGLRPGAAVTAHFRVAGKSKDGVLIPRSAIVQQDGRFWVYVQTKDDRFTRKPVPLDFPTATGFVATKGFEAGDKLVVTGAQTLLSEEFKSKNEADTN